MAYKHALDVFAEAEAAPGTDHGDQMAALRRAATGNLAEPAEAAAQ